MALRIVLVVAFCVMVVGAAGFSKEVEPLAWPLYFGGLAVTVAAGVLLKRRNLQAASVAATGSASLGALVAEVRAIRDGVAALHASAPDAAGQLAQLEALLARCSLLGQRNEDFLRALGFETYVGVWDGFATGERLLARAWSMTADGFADQGRAELPRVLAALDRAVA